jgi:probable F420-dependent oxidoreductase
MKIGVFSTFMSPLATPQMIRDFGRRAEDIGLDSIWMGEHVALFDKNTFGYPGAKDGRIPVPPGGGMLDVVATFGFLAAATSKLRLGTGVALVPQRNPIYTAKEVCTLDWLSDGRIDFGIGVGWNKEEVEACGYRWEDRGVRCDEFLEVMQRLWTEPVVDFAGKWVKLETCRLDPKPIRGGAASGGAFRRRLVWFQPRSCQHQGAARPPRRGICQSRPQARQGVPDHHDAAGRNAARRNAARRNAGIRRGRGRSSGGEPWEPAA